MTYRDFVQKIKENIYECDKLFIYICRAENYLKTRVTCSTCGQVIENKQQEVKK